MLAEMIKKERRVSVLTIEKGNMKVSDTKDNLIETKDGITCGCGNPSLKMTCHIDGVDFYSYQYNCQCGNSIEVSYKRKESVGFEKM